VPPPGYNLKDIKYQCFFDGTGLPPCQLIVPNDGKSQININKIGQYVPPKSCYNVFDALNQPPPLFQVCDNDWQGAPAQSTICVPLESVMPPPCRPVLPPCGTTAVRVSAQTLMTSATSRVDAGRTTASGRPAYRLRQSIV